MRQPTLVRPGPRQDRRARRPAYWRTLVPQIVDRAELEHPYEMPSVAVPFIAGGPDYIGWILKQTDQPA